MVTPSRGGGVPAEVSRGLRRGGCVRLLRLQGLPGDEGQLALRRPRRGRQDGRRQFPRPVLGLVPARRVLRAEDALAGRPAGRADVDAARQGGPLQPRPAPLVRPERRALQVSGRRV